MQALFPERGMGYKPALQTFFPGSGVWMTDAWRTTDGSVRRRWFGILVQRSFGNSALAGVSRRFPERGSLSFRELALGAAAFTGPGRRERTIRMRRPRARIRGTTRCPPWFAVPSAE